MNGGSYKDCDTDFETMYQTFLSQNYAKFHLIMSKNENKRPMDHDSLTW